MIEKWKRTGKRKRGNGKHFYCKDSLIINIILFSEVFKSTFFLFVKVFPRRYSFSTTIKAGFVNHN